MYLYGAIAHFHTAVLTSNERAVAERLARLQTVKHLITLSLGFANELGGVQLKIVQGYAESYSIALDCTDSANSSLHHHTPYDEKLLAPLRRPNEALVNPLGIDELIGSLSEQKDLLPGLLSDSNRLALELVLNEARTLSTEGVFRVKSLLETHRKYLFLTRPIPSLGNFPISDTEAKKYKQVKASANHLINLIQSQQEKELILGTHEMIGCLHKLQKYSEDNIDMADSILRGVMSGNSEFGSKPASSIKSLLAASKILRNEICHDHSKKIHEFDSKFSQIFDHDATSGFQVLFPLTKERLKSLYFIAGNDTSNFETLLKEWNALTGNFTETGLRIQELCEHGTNLIEELKSLPARSLMESKDHTFATNISRRKQSMQELDKNIKSLANNLEGAKNDYLGCLEKRKHLMEMVSNITFDYNAVCESKFALNEILRLRQHISEFLEVS